MRQGNISFTGNLTTRSGSDTSNPESPNGETLNLSAGSATSGTGGSVVIAAGSTTTGAGGSVVIDLGSGSTSPGFLDVMTNSSTAAPSLRLFNIAGTNSVSLKSPDSLATSYTLTLPTSAGTNGQVLSTNGSGTLSWINASTATTDPLDLTTTDPAIPPAGTVRLYRRSVGNRQMPAFIGPSGLETAIQPFFARNKIGYWNPPGNATTVPGVFGLTAPTTVGTATARNVATTNFLTRMRRLGYVGAATAGSLASSRISVAQFTTGTGTGLGGFHFVYRFGVSDPATVPGARMFVGMSSATAAPTNVEPSTLTNSIGVAQLSTDSTQWYLVYGGSSAQTAIPLGTTLGSPNLTDTAWEIALFAPPDLNGVVHYQMTNLGSNISAVGTLTPTTVGVQTPASTILMALRGWRSNNAQALSVAFDICSIYIETDN